MFVNKDMDKSPLNCRGRTNLPIACTHPDSEEPGRMQGRNGMSSTGIINLDKG